MRKHIGLFWHNSEDRIMRKSLWTILVVFVFTALSSTSARADTVVVSGLSVTAINGITISGTTYNLTFVLTSPTPYAGDPTGVAGVESQLIADLAGHSFVGAGPIIGGIVVILDNDPTGEHTVADFATGNWISDNQAQNFFCTPGSAACGSVWADFTPVSATPEPGTSVLTLSGLGLMGFLVVMRKRIALGPATG